MHMKSPTSARTAVNVTGKPGTLSAGRRFKLVISMGKHTHPNKVYGLEYVVSKQLTVKLLHART
jgi:hypothetical protein